MDEQLLDFDDIFDVWIPAWWENSWIWVAIVFGVSLLVVVFFYIMRWYQCEGIMDPRERALKRLYALDPATALTSQDRCKLFYAEVLSTVKEYLAIRYGYALSGKTDYELLDYLKRSRNSDIFYAVVKQLVEHGLTIKFARLQGEKSIVEEDYSFVLEALSKDSFLIECKK